MRLSANLSMLFAERPYWSRFDAAAAAGFQAVEVQFPEKAGSAARLRSACADAGVMLVQMNADPGDLAAGEFGLAARPGAPSRFREAIERSVDYALEAGCWRMHVLAGRRPSGETAETTEARLVDSFGWAAERFGNAGLLLLIEPLNPTDRPDYALTDFDAANRLLDRVAHPSARLQFDIYHAARCGLRPLQRLDRDLPRVGHIQVAAARDRGEPERADRLADLNALLARRGYHGYVGAEYAPRGQTEAGLGWMQTFAARQERGGRQAARLQE